MIDNENLNQTIDPENRNPDMRANEKSDCTDFAEKTETTVNDAESSPDTENVSSSANAPQNEPIADVFAIDPQFPQDAELPKQETQNEAKQDANNQSAYNQQNPWYQPQQQNYAYPQDFDARGKKRSKGKAVFLAVACILLVCVVGIFAIVLSDKQPLLQNSENGLADVPHVSAVSSADTDEAGLSSAEIYQKVFKSSVSILAYKQEGGELGVLGSGVICQEDSAGKYTYIVTCAHVINDSSYNIKVELWDGSVHTAEVVNYDDSNDIGVVRIAVTGLEIAEFGDSDEIQPGATIYAIGSPYSSKFAGTFTRGMVSAVNRLVTTQTSYQLCCIQHDAPINNGNSGGALVNAYGQIIGINALKITANGYEGLGFAVPAVTVIKVINSIIETGFAPKAPKLGISYVQAIYYSQFLSDFVEENNLPAGSIVIADITEDSSLYNSELKVNDIVTAVNGEELTTPDLLVQLIQNSNVGDSFELSVVRIIMNEDGIDYIDTETFTVTATLVEKTESDSSSSVENGQEDFYEYFGDDSGNYEDFYDYFYDYFYGNGGNSYGNDDTPEGDNRFTIPE